MTAPQNISAVSSNDPKVPAAQRTFRRILVAADFAGKPQAALRLALRLGLSFQSQVSLLHVFEYSESAVNGEAHAAQQELARLRLNACLQETKAAGLKASLVEKSAQPVAAILDTIVDEKIDLVILGTHGFRGMERPGHGSTAEQVLRKSPCPVLTVGPHAAQVMELKQPGGSVIFATDFNRASAPAISYAASFSHLLNAPLRCLHVLPRMVEGSQEDVASGIIKVALHHVAAECKAAGQNTVCDIGYGCDVSYAVIDYARAHDAQLIVLGVRQTAMNATHLPAAIAYRIITESPCPVLTIAVQHNNDAKLSAACL